MSITIETHDTVTEAELDELIQMALDDVGVELDELRAQAQLGRFSSEALRRTWFMVSGLGRG